jgi:2-polyprenyl-3-methyl-5-hydroxy-6-metoxy-1,4-benzoquinol methylase
VVDGYSFLSCGDCGLIHLDAATLARIDAGETVFRYAEDYWASEMIAARERAFGLGIARSAEVFLCARRPMMRFLDVGTGPGTLLDALALYLPHIADRFHGVELFPPPDEHRSRHPNYRIGRVRDYTDGFFDGGMCMEVFEHLTPAMLATLLSEVAAVSRDKACFLVNTGLAQFARDEVPSYLDPVGRGHITIWTVKAVNCLARPYGLVASEVPGRSWCFLLEKGGDPKLSVAERAVTALPENLAALHHPGAGASPVALLASIALRETYYYNEFLARSRWALTLNESNEQLREQLAVAHEKVAALQAAVAAVHESTSWRITAGLRQIARASRRAQNIVQLGHKPALNPDAATGALAMAQQPASDPAADASSVHAQQPEPPHGSSLHVRLKDIGEWRSFEAAHQDRIGQDAVRRIILKARTSGLTSKFFGAVRPEDVSMQGPDARENLVAFGLNARQRALLELLVAEPAARDVYRCRIYAHEGVTPFALLLRGRYPYFLGSEYAADASATSRFWPVPAVDITQSGFDESVFDFVLSQEVFEHVPDLEAALRDTCRILKPGGHLLATVRFDWKSEATVIRARLVDGVVEHILPPEYHSNPVDPEGGSLVFQIPGWDILDLCRRAGFGDAGVVFCSSEEAGITASTIAGIFLLDAIK